MTCDDLPVDIAEALLAYQDDELSTAAHRRLTDWLAEDAEHPGAARAWLADQMHLYRALRPRAPAEEAERLLSLASLRRGSQRQVNIRRIMGRTHGRRPHQRIALRLWLGTAVAAAAALVLAILLPDRPADSQHPVVATWQATVGQVAQPLMEGERIWLAAGGGGTLRWRDGSHAVVEGPAGFTVATASGPGLTIDAGSFRIAALPQPAERPMRITTPHGSVMVLGTRFLVAVRPDSTQVAVENGRVEVRDRTSGRWLLAAGEERNIQRAEETINAFHGPGSEWRIHGSELLTWNDDNGSVAFNLDRQWRSCAIWSVRPVDAAATVRISVEILLPPVESGVNCFVDLSTSPDPQRWDRGKDLEFEPLIYRRLECENGGLAFATKQTAGDANRRRTPLDAGLPPGTWTRLELELRASVLHATCAGQPLGSFATDAGADPAWIGLRVSGKSRAKGQTLRIGLRNLSVSWPTAP